jgi:8-oxo-dGTP pyrophosphatase MutT (NUDIX family)
MVRIETLSKAPSIKIDRPLNKLSAATLDRIDRAWEELCADNPRYFESDMLAYVGFNSDSNTIDARVEPYKHHAVRDAVDLGITLLAVTGILVAEDHGQPRFLIGKRSPTTHRYGNMWEVGPCGGIDVPGDRIDGLDYAAIVGELGREAMEEAGIDLSGAPTMPVALVHDDLVGSTDIVIRVELPEIPAVRSSWEYAECQWVSLDELSLWIESNPETFIPTTIAIARLVGAIGGYD